MTAEIINLRRARKARDQRAKDARAHENRAIFGRSRPDLEKQKAERALGERRLDDALRAPSKDAGNHDQAGVPGTDSIGEPGSTK